MKNLDWKNLPFGYTPTDYNVRCYYRNGKWGEVEVSSSDTIGIHMAATTLHYGQEAFEGTKAFRGRDGKIRLFRWKDNSQRLKDSAEALIMPAVPDEIFFEALRKVVLLNKDFVPPYESGATLYVRPLLIGTGAQVGVRPAEEYLFMIFVTPVGPYFKEGFKPVKMLVERDFDRAAPMGTGRYKVGGNYAASLRSIRKAQQRGFANVIFADARHKKYIDECGPANFFGIKNNTYVTPDSPTILPSVTNKSLMALAEAIGLRVECRPVEIEELATFEEAGACGTAAVISPICEILDESNNKTYTIGKSTEAGEISKRLYNKLQAIQYGDEPDTFGWVTIIE